MHQLNTTRQTTAFSPHRMAAARHVILFLCCLVLAGCAGLVQRDANNQIAAGQSEQALRTLEEGLRKYPEDAPLRAQYLALRESLVQQWLADAQRLRTSGRPDEAERALTRIHSLDPTNSRLIDMQQALQTDKRLAALMQEAKALIGRGLFGAGLRLLDEGLKSDPHHDGLLALKRHAQVSQRDQQLKTTQAGLAEQRPVTLDFREAGLRQVLDLVSRHSGVNFVLDNDVRQDLRITVYLKQVKVEDALDLIVSTHQLARKVLDERTVLLYPNTPEKQREYQEQVIRVFYLASAEAKGAAAFLKSMLKVKEPFVDERSNMLALREPPETIVLAERLVGLYDTQEPEVLLELEVLEVRSTRLTELGIKLPNSVSLTPLAPAAGGTLTVSNLNNLGWDRVGVSIGGVTVNLRREVGDFEILANPRVRAKNREKAKVLIGDKVPIITTTTGQMGFVGDSVSYLDVGLKLDIEPTIYANDEVMIRLALEVGSLASQIRTPSGTVAYQISTRNASTALRLKDGETQLLAGLLSKEDRTSASRLPLVGDLPMLGRLFGSQLDDGSRTELILAITPRIVRNIRQPDASEAELWVGTEAYTRLRQAGGRVANEAASPSATPSVAPTGQPQTSPAAPTIDVSDPPSLATPRASEVSPPTSLGASPSVNEMDARIQGAASTEAVAQKPVLLRWQSVDGIKVGKPFTLTLDGDLTTGLRGMNLTLQCEPRQVRLIEAKEGLLWQQGGAKVSVSSSMSEGDGSINVGVLRNDATAASGSGHLIELRLVAQRAGRLALTLAQANPISLDAVRPDLVLPQQLVLEVGQ